MRSSKESLLSRDVVFRLSRFSKPYRQRLLSGLMDLDAFCSREAKCSLSYLLSHVLRADEMLAQYVMCKHASSEGRKLYLVKHALLCCQHIQPRLKGHISTAWENLRVWEEQRVSKLRPPLPSSSLADDDRPCKRPRAHRARCREATPLGSFRSASRSGATLHVQAR